MRPAAIWSVRNASFSSDRETGIPIEDGMRLVCALMTYGDGSSLKDKPSPYAAEARSSLRTLLALGTRDGSPALRKVGPRPAILLGQLVKIHDVQSDTYQGLKVIPFQRHSL